MNRFKLFLGNILSFLALFVILCNPVYAGERVPAGTVVSEESYVFSIEEAGELVETIEALEAEVADQEELIGLYKELDQVHVQKYSELEESLKIRNEQIAYYEEWREVDEKRIKALERQQKVTKFERWGFFALGMAVTFGFIIVADKIDDKVIENN